MSFKHILMTFVNQAKDGFAQDARFQFAQQKQMFADNMRQKARNIFKIALLIILTVSCYLFGFLGIMLSILVKAESLAISPQSLLTGSLLLLLLPFALGSVFLARRALN